MKPGTKFQTCPLDWLHASFLYEPDTGALINRKTGKEPKGVLTRVRGISLLKARICFAMHHDRWPEMQIDHKDGNRQNNRADNLRDVSALRNGQNKRADGRNRTGVKGVYPNSHGTFKAQIGVNNRVLYLGSFPTIEAAKAAYDAAALEHFGEFRREGDER